MVTASNDSLSVRLERYFSVLEKTGELADQLRNQRQNPLDLITLISARIDGLASTARPQDMGSKEAFSRFVTVYSGEKDLMNSVSVPDLCRVLDFYSLFAELVVPRPGRAVGSIRQDWNVMSLILDIEDLAVTSTEVRDFLVTLTKGLRATYRVLPGQPRSRPFSDKAENVLQALVEHLSNKPKKRHLVPQFSAPFRKLLNSFTLVEILYSSYRNQSIHGLGVDMDLDKFWSEQHPYWTLARTGLGVTYFTVEFPAAFLCGLLAKVLTNFNKCLVNKGKVPPDVFFEICALDETAPLIDWLDDDLTPKVKPMLSVRNPHSAGAR